MSTEEINEKAQAGRAYARGVFSELWHNFGLLFLLFIILNLMRNAFDWELDDSDKDGFHRSGLTIHTDYKTGVQYLSDGHGGLTPRLPKP